MLATAVLVAVAVAAWQLIGLGVPRPGTSGTTAASPDGIEPGAGLAAVTGTGGAEVGLMVDDPKRLCQKVHRQG